MDYKLYRVHWVDSTSTYGWVLRSEEAEFDLNVYGVGYLIRETEDYVLFSAHVAAECYDAPICIRRKSIISMKEIKDG
jgi:hypothetical protein